MDKRMVMSVIIAIFAALAAGILIGSELVADQGSLAAYQQIIYTIEREFDRVKDQARQLEVELTDMAGLLEEERRVERELGDQLVAGMLSEMTVGVVCWGVEQADAVEQTIRHGGAVLAKRLSVRGDSEAGVGEEDLVAGVLLAAGGLGSGEDWLQSVGDACLAEADVVIIAADGDSPPPLELVQGLGELGPRVIVAYDGPGALHVIASDELTVSVPYVNRGLGAVLLARLVSGDL